MVTHAYYWFILDPKKKQDKSKFKKLNNFELKQKLHAVHLPTLLDKMCEYEMDLASIVEDTERTRFCPQTGRRTIKTSIPPFKFVEQGYKIALLLSDLAFNPRDHLLRRYLDYKVLNTAFCCCSRVHAGD